MANDNEQGKLKVVFAPGAFDKFEGTQEELDEILAEIQAMADSGEILEKATIITEEMINDLLDDVIRQLYESFEEDFIVDNENELNDLDMQVKLASKERNKKLN